MHLKSFFAARFPIKIAEDEHYQWDQVIIYLDEEEVVNAANQGGILDSSYPCEYRAQTNAYILFVL